MEKLKKIVLHILLTIRELFRMFFAKYATVEELPDELKKVHRIRKIALFVSWVLMIGLSLYLAGLLTDKENDTLFDAIFAFFVMMLVTLAVTCIPITLAHLGSKSMMMPATIVACLPSSIIVETVSGWYVGFGEMWIVKLAIIPAFILLVSCFTGWFFVLMDTILFFQHKSLVYPSEIKKFNENLKNKAGA